ncbi:MAG: dihydropteroate synthase [Caulobacterales bacterium]|uniref:dihydropteroate synthase n=1 Tax=Glycocaulis sp. TaxID=1969725 RepID=UPI003F9FC2DC
MSDRPFRPLVMGIVNVTPDSFSDGGRHGETASAIAHGKALVAAGADWLDIGGESTRPGAVPVSVADELQRVIPVMEGLSGAGVPLSIDTMKPAVAEVAMKAGARLWNDVNALRADGAPQMAANLMCEVCLMHMQGAPQTMQENPVYDDVVGEVEAFLLERADAVMAAGVPKEKIWLDPGIGFGKTLAHNLALMAALSRLAGHGFPLLFGASRKRFIAALDRDAAADERLGGSIAAALHAAASGATMVRVHDVRETVQALTVHAAIREAD